MAIPTCEMTSPLVLKNKISPGRILSKFNQSFMKVLSSSENIGEVVSSTREDTNLFDFKETSKLISTTKPNVIINAAAKVGGIYANNTKRTEFILENLKINLNLLESCIPFPDIKIINLGSSCIYPLNAENPIKEDYFMSGKLEPTNSPYAMAKLTARGKVAGWHYK